MSGCLSLAASENCVLHPKLSHLPNNSVHSTEWTWDKWTNDWCSRYKNQRFTLLALPHFARPIQSLQTREGGREGEREGSWVSRWSMTNGILPILAQSLRTQFRSCRSFHFLSNPLQSLARLPTGTRTAVNVVTCREMVTSPENYLGQSPETLPDLLGLLTSERILKNLHQWQGWEKLH